MTRYAGEQALEIAIHAERTTDAQAAAHFGIPRRSVTAVRRRLQDRPEMALARARLSEHLADQYAELEQKAIRRADVALDDPETPARDVASLGKWISEQRALLTGAATSRNANVNLTANVTAGMDDAQRAEARRLLDDMIRADQVDDALAAIPDPTAELSRDAIVSLIDAIERRLAS